MARPRRPGTRPSAARGAGSEAVTSRPSTASTVVTVATSERRVVDHGVGVGRRHPGHGVPGQDELVAGVHGVEGEVGHADVHRHADADDGRRPEVAQDHVEVRATHRAEPVQAGQDDVGRLDPDLRADLDRLGARRELTVGLGRDGEQPGVVVRPPAIGTAGGDAVDDVDPRRPGPRDQPSGRLEHPAIPGRTGQLRERRRLAEHADLALLGDHDRVRRVNQRREVHRHGRKASAGCGTRKPTPAGVECDHERVADSRANRAPDRTGSAPVRGRPSGR